MTLLYECFIIMSTYKKTTTKKPVINKQVQDLLQSFINHEIEK